MDYNLSIEGRERGNNPIELRIIIGGDLQQLRDVGFNSSDIHITNHDILLFLASEGKLGADRNHILLSRSYHQGDMVGHYLDNNNTERWNSIDRCSGTISIEYDFNGISYMLKNMDTFVAFMTERKLTLFKAQKEHIVKSSSISTIDFLEPKNNNSPAVIPDINYEVPPLMVLPEGIFSVNLKPTRYKTMRGVLDNAKKELNKLYDARIKAQVAALNEQITLEKQKATDNLNVGFIEGVTLLKEFGDTWTVKDGYLVMKGRIEMERVVYDGIFYNAPSDYFVKDIKVEISERVHRAYCSAAYHPNCDNVDSRLCLGTLEDKPLKTVLSNIKEMVKTGNMNSAYDGTMTEIIRELIDADRLEEVGARREAVWDTY